jgi:tRNA A-37 threonylcarbamoyl transferase component Bud32
MTSERGPRRTRWARLGSALADAVRGVPLEPAAEDAFQRERLATNLDRIGMFTPLMVLVHLISIAVYRPRAGDQGESLAFHLVICALHVGALAVVGASWLLLSLDRRAPAIAAVKQVVTDAYVLLYVVFGAGLSANAQRINGNQNSYTVALLAVTTVFRQQGGRAAVTLGLGLSAYLGGVWAIQPDAELRMAAVGPATVVTILAWMVSRANSSALRRAVAARITIESQRAELEEHKRVLEEMNKELGERVAARTGEIARLHDQLRENVVDRSRDLLRALRAVSGVSTPGRLEVGSIFAERIEIRGLLGRGGMGEVYLGDDRITGRRVALKLMRPELSVSREALERFVSEARAAAAIDHAAVVRTLHVDVSPEGRLYQLIEYVAGWTLEHELSCGRLEYGAACRLGAVVASALAAAHARGVVHRDVKPSNVMLTDTPPGVRLMDFGASKFVHEDDAMRMTADDQVLGTPLYMAPEQIMSPRDVAAPADVYALGAVLFEMLAGHAPFASAAGSSVLLAQVAQPAPVLRDVVDVPPSLSSLVDAALSKDPRGRPEAASMAALLEDLADAAGAPPAERVATPARVRGAASTLGVEP